MDLGRSDLSSPQPRLSVLRICSVFEPPAELRLDAASGFDPIGGMQNHTAELTRNLDRRGVRQVVVTTRPPGAPARQRVGASAEVIRLGWRIRRFRQLYSLPALPAVVRAGREVDLVHIHLGEDLAVVPLGLAASAVRGAPMVITIHCSLRHTFDGPSARDALLRTVGGRIETIGVRRAAAVIVITRRLARALAADVDPARIHLIPAGVDPDLFRGPFEDPLPEVPRPRVLFMGRLAPQKAVLRLIRAMPLIRPEAHVVLVGDGPQRRAVEAEATRLGVRDRLVVTGFVHHAEVPAHLAHADLVVLPSTHEELGSVLIEATQVGVPAVGNRAGGIPEAIRDGESGLLCDAADPRELAEAVNRVLDDPELRAKLAAGARADAGRYDWPALADDILRLYRSVVGGARGRP